MKSKRRWTPQEDELLRQESQKQLTSRSLPCPLPSPPLNLISAFPRSIPFSYTQSRSWIWWLEAQLNVCSPHGTGPTGRGNTINWSEVAKHLPGRSNKDCRKRYLNEMAGTLKKVSGSCTSLYSRLISPFRVSARPTLIRHVNSDRGLGHKMKMPGSRGSLKNTGSPG